MSSDSTARTRAVQRAVRAQLPRLEPAPLAPRHRPKSGVLPASVREVGQRGVVGEVAGGDVVATLGAVACQRQVPRDRCLVLT